MRPIVTILLFVCLPAAGRIEACDRGIVPLTVAAASADVIAVVEVTGTSGQWGVSGARIVAST